ncbi:unnamed protein product [Gordionus sp. m RMFG-2023]
MDKFAIPDSGNNLYYYNSVDNNITNDLIYNISNNETSIEDISNIIRHESTTESYDDRGVTPWNDEVIYVTGYSSSKKPSPQMSPTKNYRVEPNCETIGNFKLDINCSEQTPYKTNSNFYNWVNSIDMSNFKPISNDLENKISYKLYPDSLYSIMPEMQDENKNFFADIPNIVKMEPMNGNGNVKYSVPCKHYNLLNYSDNFQITLPIMQIASFSPQLKCPSQDNSNNNSNKTKSYNLSNNLKVGSKPMFPVKSDLFKDMKQIHRNFIYKKADILFPKPPYSYSCLIALALKNSKTGCLPVNEIYEFMCENFPYFKTAPDGWKNSVRHNLSLNKSFEKIEIKHNTSKKGCLWALNKKKINKMNDEIFKWRKKDLTGILRAMRCSEDLILIEEGRWLNRNPHNMGINHDELYHHQNNSLLTHDNPSNKKFNFEDNNSSQLPDSTVKEPQFLSETISQSDGQTPFSIFNLKNNFRNSYPTNKYPSNQYDEFNMNQNSIPYGNLNNDATQNTSYTFSIPPI